MKYNLVDDYNKIAYPIKEGNFQGASSPNLCYVVYNNITKLTKVGITKNLKERLRALECQSGCSITTLIVLELEPECDESALFIEQYVHYYFRDKRTIGEWFYLNIKDIIEIKNLFWAIEGCFIEEIQREDIPPLIN